MAKKASTVNFLAGLSGLVLVYEAPAIFGFQPLTRGVNIAISIAYIIGIAAALYIMRADTKGSIGKFAQDNSEALSRACLQSSEPEADHADGQHGAIVDPALL